MGELGEHEVIEEKTVARNKLPVGQPKWGSPGFQCLLAQALDSALRLEEPCAQQFGDLLGVGLGGGCFHDLAG